MTLEHKGAQKRIYISDAAYFITVKTLHNEPFFEERIFCDVFVEELRVCKQLKGYELYGWVLVYDHFHFLIKPNGTFNYSQIMKSLKENVSCSINRIIDPEGATPASRLQEIYANKYDIFGLQSKFQQIHPTFDTFARFHWQKSFHDHYCRNEMDLRNHLEYMIDNLYHHPLPRDWPYVFTNPKYATLLDSWS